MGEGNCDGKEGDAGERGGTGEREGTTGRKDVRIEDIIGRNKLDQGKSLKA